MWEILRRSIQRGVVTARPAVRLPDGVTRAPSEPHGEIELLGQALQTEIHRLFGRSLRVRQVDAGSCNGCESEVQSVMGPFYDLQRFGIDIVASPRHADALLVTGPPARHLEEALRLTDEATPRPRLVIALGDCACHGGFCAGSFAVRDGLQSVIDVDVRIPGCPPRPDEFIDGILKLKETIMKEKWLVRREAG
jgi:Ni,Fe-hydrogenase III small subunit